MKTYTGTIVERYSFEVEANSKQEAIQKLELDYRDYELNPDFQGYEIESIVL